MGSWSLEYSIDVDEDNSVIHVKIHGQWKIDTAKRYHEDFKHDMEPLFGRPWAKLVDLTNWKTSRDEVTGVIGRHMAWSKANNIGLSIYIIDNPSTFRQLNEMFVKGGTKSLSHTFRTTAEAKKFLKENWLDKPR
ncbi:MAG: hypothetical protein DRP45_04680 [Candidatus Zixiibacteriota bacterium]|nr:MAG: hypothetical protein DRP45_04680 [candidate division Zixibacteria bacterium]